MNTNDISCSPVSWSPDDPLLSDEEDEEENEAKSEARFYGRSKGVTCSLEKFCNYPHLLMEPEKTFHASLKDNEDQNACDDKTTDSSGIVDGTPDRHGLFFLEENVDNDLKIPAYLDMEFDKKKIETQLFSQDKTEDILASRRSVGLLGPPNRLPPLKEKGMIALDMPVTVDLNDSNIVAEGDKSKTEDEDKEEQEDTVSVQRKVDVPLGIDETLLPLKLQNSALVPEGIKSVTGDADVNDLSPEDRKRPVFFFDDDKNLIIASEGPVNISISVHRVISNTTFEKAKAKMLPSELNNSEMLQQRSSSSEHILEDYLGSSPIISYLPSSYFRKDSLIDEGMEIPLSASKVQSPGTSNQKRPSFCFYTEEYTQESDEHQQICSYRSLSTEELKDELDHNLSLKEDISLASDKDDTSENGNRFIQACGDEIGEEQVASSQISTPTPVDVQDSPVSTLKMRINDSVTIDTHDIGDGVDEGINLTESVKVPVKQRKCFARVFMNFLKQSHKKKTKKKKA